MLAYRVPEGLIVRHAGFVQRGQVELDEAGPLCFRDAQAAVRVDQVGSYREGMSRRLSTAATR